MKTNRKNVVINIKHFVAFTKKQSVHEVFKDVLFSLLLNEENQNVISVLLFTLSTQWISWKESSDVVVFNLIFIVFFPLPCIHPPPIPSSASTHHPPPHNHHTIVHVHESFSLFAQSLRPLPPPQLAVICSPSMSLSLFCLWVQCAHSSPQSSDFIDKVISEGFLVLTISSLTSPLVFLF